MANNEDGQYSGYNAYQAIYNNEAGFSYLLSWVQRLTSDVQRLTTENTDLQLQLQHLKEMYSTLPQLVASAVSHSTAQATVNNVSLDYNQFALALAQALQEKYTNGYLPGVVESKGVEKGVDFESVESVQGVQTPLQTPHQTHSTPANKASVGGVSHASPDTLVDTPDFRRCVENGMTKTALAKRFGVSESTVARAKRKLATGV